MAGGHACSYIAKSARGLYGALFAIAASPQKRTPGLKSDRITSHEEILS
jgi:hypothetical protein